MTRLVAPSPGERGTRALAALASATLVGGLCAALVLGLRVEWQRVALEDLVSIATTPDKPAVPPPPPPPPEPVASSRAAAREAPAPEAKAPTPVFAARTPLVAPPIVAVPTPAAGSGSAPGAGLVGAGQGAGGSGSGTGGGGNGGDGAGITVKARQIAGKLRFSDIPDGLLPTGRATEVGVTYAVETDGRVTGCRASETSGVARVDAVVCDLIERRFRYRPARDAGGNPVRSTVHETHGWWVDGKEREAPAD